MRRILLMLFGACLGTSLLVGLKSTGLGAPAGVVADAPLDPAAGTDPAAPPGPGTDPGGPPPGSTPATPPAAGSTPRPGATTPGAGRPPTTTPPGGAPTTTRPAGTAVTVKGAAIAVQTAQSPTAKSSTCRECHDYAIAVTITVSGGRITASSVSYSTSPGSSQSYANRANSALTPKVLTAQTWNLGRVSGATYSGNAWELSLKDAMSKAGLPT